MPSHGYAATLREWDDVSLSLLGELAPRLSQNFSLVEAELDEGMIVEQVDRYLGLAGQLIAMASEESDLDVDLNVSALAIDAAVMIEALTGAGSEPFEYADLAALSYEDLGRGWLVEHETCLATIAGLRRVQGAAVVAPSLLTSLGTLETATGKEVVALLGHGLVQAAPGMLAGGITELLSDAGARAFREFLGALGGLANWLKRQATRIVGALVGWIQQNLPAQLVDLLPAAGQSISAAMAKHAGAAVGDIASLMFGRNDTLADWARITSGDQVVVITDGLSDRGRNVARVTAAREKITDSWVNRILRVLIGLAGPLQIAFFVAIAGLMSWVLYQLWAGLRLR